MGYDAKVLFWVQNCKAGRCGRWRNCRAGRVPAAECPPPFPPCPSPPPGPSCTVASSHRWTPYAKPRSGHEESRPRSGGRGPRERCYRVLALTPVRASQAERAAEPPPHQACGPARHTVPGRPETYAARRSRGPTWCSLPRRFSAHQKPKLSSAVWAAR
ncbi:hypothetical protein mRhiFer1_010184 [Rhinolophus ferrumequinum]|uniref:Uncharacterized protein n=1 Tax=Rhinolophus ferrumequinum TaxID=59479 RepID=A0A7J7XQ72_RHIFE|nr:hypothetical protein mRhiFer1_010184 [Rhinolophus ferrumequinum]